MTAGYKAALLLQRTSQRCERGLMEPISVTRMCTVNVAREVMETTALNQVPPNLCNPGYTSEWTSNISGDYTNRFWRKNRLKSMQTTAKTSPAVARMT